MKRASYKWLLFSGSLLIPAALVEISASGSSSGRDTTQVSAEAINQTMDDTPADQGLLGYLFNRKRTEDSEQAPVGADVREAYNGPLEEQGLIDFLLGKKPQPLVIAATIPVANKPLPEPVGGPLPEGGLINYLFNRGNTSLKPAASPVPAVNASQPTHATAKSSISTSQVLARSATTVESAAISDGQAPSGIEVKEAYNGPLAELGLIDFLLGKKPQPLVIAAAIPVVKKPVPEPVEAPLPKGGLINYLFSRGNASPRPVAGFAQAVSRSQRKHATRKSSIGKSLVPAKYMTAYGPAVLREDLLRIKVVLGQLPRSARASREQSNHVARTPKIENAVPLVENTDPQLELTQKYDSRGPATAVIVERTGLLELLLRRHPNVAGVEATRAPSGDNNGN